MNNWRLLLLALVAVFQPIASFTESNLVDGRQQCCDRQSDTSLRDSRSSIYGVQRFTKASTTVRRVNDWDATRKAKRFELRQRGTEFTRRTERSLSDIRESDTGRNTRFTRVANRPERISLDENRQYRLDVQRSERYADNLREVNPEARERRSLNRFTRDSVMRHDERSNDLSSRNTLSRDHIQFSRFSYDRMAREFDSRRERMQTKTGDLRRLASVRDARDNHPRLTSSRMARHSLSRPAPRDVRDNSRQTREDVVSVENTDQNRRYYARRQITRDVRKTQENNNNRGEHERHAELRRSLSENSRYVDRIRDSRMRIVSRDDRRENRDSVSADRRPMSERSAELREQTDNRRQFREQLRENTDRLSDRIRDLSRDERRESRDSERSAERRLQTVSRRQHREQIRENTDSLFDRIRDNSRDNRRENRESASAERRPLSERSGIRRQQTDNLKPFREQIRENADRLSVRARLERRKQTDSGRPSREQIRESTDRLSESIRVISRDERRENRDSERSAERRQQTDSRRQSREQIRENSDRLFERTLLNSREEKRVNRNSVRAERRPLSERSAERRRQINNRRESREQIRENTDRLSVRSDSRSTERLQMERRDTRVSRLVNDRDTHLDRAAESRQDIRYRDPLTRDTRGQSVRLQSEELRTPLERDNRMLNRRTRSLDVLNVRDTRVTARHSQITEVVRGQVEYRNKRENREREIPDTRLRNVESARNRNVMVHKIETASDSTASNWPYIFYTLQGAYLCGLLMQILTASHTGKSNTMYSHWWPLSSQRLIKVD